MKDKVAIIGTGMVERFGELFHKSFDDMIEEAYLNALASVPKGLDPKAIEAAWFGTVRGRGGHTLADACGLYGIPVTRVENACATGSDAFRNACMAIAAGACDVALVVGAEKLRDRAGGLIEGADSADIHRAGKTLPALFGLFAVRHMHDYGTKREHLAMISVKNHANGALYPPAHFRMKVTVEDVLKSPVITWPLNLYDCCPVTDGAAAALLCRADLAKKYTDEPIFVSGLGFSTSMNPLAHPGVPPVVFPATVDAGQRAYKMAGVGPRDLDVAEVHDCYSIAELLHYEDLGFCKKGEGGKFIEEGRPNLDGEIPINPSGGLLSKGHPIGATGVAQIVEITEQLQGRAGKVQVPDAEVGLTHNLGAGDSGLVAFVSVLRR